LNIFTFEVGFTVWFEKGKKHSVLLFCLRQKGVTKKKRRKIIVDRIRINLYFNTLLVIVNGKSD